MIRFALAILIGIALGSVAEACNRCGFRQCRFTKKVVVSGYQYPVTYQYPAVYAYPVTITNNYPAGAYPLGQTVYSQSVAAAAQVYATNPSEQLALLGRMSDGLNQGVAKVTATIEANNARAADIAKMQLAVEHLRAVSAVTASEAEQVTLKVTSQGGEIRVERLDQAEQGAEHQMQGSSAAAGDSLLAAKCARCHGLEQSQPKAGLYYDAGHALTKDTAFDALRVLKGVDAPEPMKAVIEGLTAEEIAGLEDEILSLATE